MSGDYEVVFHGEVLDVFMRLRSNERRALFRFFDALAAMPGTKGDFV